MRELWDLYDRDRRLNGGHMYRGEKQPEGTFRLAVCICMFNKEGKLLIQRRAQCKDWQPGMWDISVGGAAKAGEDSRTAMERELAEELGIRRSFADERPVLTVHFEDGFIDVYTWEANLDTASLNLQAEEVSDVRYATREEVLSMIEDGTFLPYYRGLMDYLFFLRNHRGTQVT